MIIKKHTKENAHAIGDITAKFYDQSGLTVKEQAFNRILRKLRPMFPKIMKFYILGELVQEKRKFNVICNDGFNALIKRLVGDTTYTGYINKDKLFAFEIKNIMKALRNLAQNIIALNRSTHWEFIKSESYDSGYVYDGSSGSTTITPPSDWNFAVVSYTVLYNSKNIEGQLIIAREGVTSQYQRHFYGVDNNDYWMRARGYVSGNDVIVSYNLGYSYGTSGRRINGNIYFYK